MVFYNYRLAVVTPPGAVPKGWVSSIVCRHVMTKLTVAQRPTMSGMEGMEVKKTSHAPRFCKMCEHYKPPRSEPSLTSSCFAS